MLKLSVHIADEMQDHFCKPNKSYGLSTEIMHLWNKKTEIVNGATFRIINYYFMFMFAPPPVFAVLLVSLTSETAKKPTRISTNIFDLKRLKV